jgi:hypothetical protein
LVHARTGMGTCCPQASEESNDSRPYLLLLWRLRRHSRSKTQKPSSTRAAASLLQRLPTNARRLESSLWAAVRLRRGTEGGARATRRPQPASRRAITGWTVGD